jgi:hypothetical protein
MCVNRAVIGTGGYSPTLLSLVRLANERAAEIKTSET